MARFLLIHGSCHGAWCWREVLPLLHAAGHTAAAIDLPGAGADPTPAAEVTLEACADAVLAALGEGPPAVLVGHSAAGFPITRAALRAPGRVALLVYLCAYVPAPGMSLADMRRAGPSQPLLEVIDSAPDGLTFRFRPEKTRAALYHDCPPGTAQAASRLLTPQPVAPQETALPGPEVVPAVPRHYVICDDDRAIPPAYQRTMSAEFAPENVHRLPTSHSPFFAAPGRLADLLMRIADP